MAQPVQQWIATAAFGAALATSVAVVAPQVFAQPAVSVETAPFAAEAEPAFLDAAADGAVDMNHWQETAAPVSPYVPGPVKKGK